MELTRKTMLGALVVYNIIRTVSAVTGASVIAPFSNAVCGIFGTLIPAAAALMIATYAALLWIYSREDPAMRERAKKMFILVVLGLIVLRISKPIVLTLFPEVGELCPE